MDEDTDTAPRSSKYFCEVDLNFPTNWAASASVARVIRLCKVDASTFRNFSYRRSVYLTFILELVFGIVRM